MIFKGKGVATERGGGRAIKLVQHTVKLIERVFEKETTKW